MILHVLRGSFKYFFSDLFSGERFKIFYDDYKRNIGASNFGVFAASDEF
jgi:hypothetical protein